jgi:hypothetical protein
LQVAKSSSKQPIEVAFLIFHIFANKFFFIKFELSRVRSEPKTGQISLITKAGALLALFCPVSGR